MSNQRARLIGAMIELASSSGYNAITIRDLTRAAGVSKASFYSVFSDKRDCFAASYDCVVRTVVRDIFRHETVADGSEARLQACISAFVSGVTAHPKAARLVLIEGPTAGFALSASGGRKLRIFEQLVSGRFSQAPSGIELPPLLAHGIVAGLAYVAGTSLLSGRTDGFASLSGPLLDWTLTFNDPAAVDLRRNVAIVVGVDLDRYRVQTTPSSTSPEERHLIFRAVLREAEKHGRVGLTKSQICATAGVPRRSFESNFESVDDCFVASLSHRVNAQLKSLAAVLERTSSWPEGVRLALRLLADSLSREPRLARLAFVEMPTLGVDGARWQQRTITAIATHIRGSAPPGFSQLSSEASVAAVWGIISLHVAADDMTRLSQQIDLLAFLVLAPAIGSGAARASLDAKGS